MNLEQRRATQEKSTEMTDTHFGCEDVFSQLTCYSTLDAVKLRVNSMVAMSDIRGNGGNGLVGATYVWSQ